MKFPFIRLLSLVTLLGAVALRAEEPAKPAAPPDDTVLLADLRAETAGIFQYATWEGKIAVTKSGLVVLGAKGAQGNGGFGHDIGKAVDMTNVTDVEVAIGVVPSNEVPQITIALNDEDGTQYTARINIDQLVPGSPVWLRAHKADFRLNSLESGKDGKMDWSRVTRWHLQGDWTTKKPFAVAFIALRTRK
jgi:hypothetical protein